MRLCKHALIGSVIILVGLSGCQGFIQATPTQVPASVYTEAAATVVMDLTLNAPATETPLPPTATQLPATATPTSSPTPAEPSATAAPATITPQPTVTPSLTPTPDTVKVIYRDNFSSQTGWEEDSKANYGFIFKDGGYQIRNFLVNAAIWSIREQDYTDIGVRAEAYRISGPEDGYYGVVCRFVDSANYYAFVIESDGQYRITKMVKGKMSTLQEESAPAGVITPGTGKNSIRGDCLGNQLTLYVNGQKLLRVEDDDLTTGSVGMIVGTQRYEGLIVQFTSFEILQP